MGKLKCSLSPKKSIATSSNAKLKRMNVDALTTTETVGSGLSSRGNGERRIVVLDEEESDGEKESQDLEKKRKR